MKLTEKYDIVVLGGGLAGMTAGVYAARANRTCAILEAAITGGLANATYTVENFPSYTTVHGMELMQKVRDQVDHLGVHVEEICEIESLDLMSQPKRVTTNDAVYEAKTVIIATGRKPILLDTPTQCDQLHYCAICDGAAYKGKKVIVVGGGNSAFDEGLYLLQLGVTHLTLVEKMPCFFAVEATQASMLRHANVEAFTRTAVSDVETVDGIMKSAILENLDTGEKRRIAADGAFIFLGQEPNSEMFKDIVKVDTDGYVVADENMQTNVPGVFSAGDINAKKFRQLTTAAADGTIAALMADKFIRTL